MSYQQPSELVALLNAATPFLRINDVARMDWCRVMLDPSDSRIGPWKYRAVYEVLDEKVWKTSGEVLYFITNVNQTLRLVGQSKDRLKTRWRTSPMFEASTKAPLGEQALFHSSTWPAIEKGLVEGERPPFTVSAIFREKLIEICKKTGGPLEKALRQPEMNSQRLSYHVETWICSLSSAGLNLWNKQKVQARAL